MNPSSTDLIRCEVYSMQWSSLLFGVSDKSIGWVFKARPTLLGRIKLHMFRSFLRKDVRVPSQGPKRRQLRHPRRHLQVCRPFHWLHQYQCWLLLWQSPVITLQRQLTSSNCCPLLLCMLVQGREENALGKDIQRAQRCWRRPHQRANCDRLSHTFLPGISLLSMSFLAVLVTNNCKLQSAVPSFLFFYV